MRHIQFVGGNSYECPMSHESELHNYIGHCSNGGCIPLRPKFTTSCTVLRECMPHQVACSKPPQKKLRQEDEKLRDYIRWGY